CQYLWSRSDVRVMIDDVKHQLLRRRLGVAQVEGLGLLGVDRQAPGVQPVR
ncbi:jg5580, partial [Pararge aegeria aegeria]